jgi:hypothetical protein
MSNDEMQVQSMLLACGGGSQIPRCSCGRTAAAASASAIPMHSPPGCNTYPSPWLARGREIRKMESSIRNTHLPYHPLCVYKYDSLREQRTRRRRGRKSDRAIIVLETKRRSRWNLLGGSGRRCWREETKREGNVVALVVAVECRRPLQLCYTLAPC